MKSIYPALLIAGACVLFFSINARAEMRAESVGYNFTKYYGIETAAEFIETRVDDTTRTGLAEGQSGSFMDRANLIFYHIDAVYHFMPDSKFPPFVIVGLGGAHYNPMISTGGMAGITFAFGDNEKSFPVAQEKIVSLLAEPKDIAIAFDDIHFDFDWAALKPEAKKNLKKNLRIVKENP